MTWAKHGELKSRVEKDFETDLMSSSLLDLMTHLSKNQRKSIWQRHGIISRPLHALALSFSVSSITFATQQWCLKILFKF